MLVAAEVVHPALEHGERDGHVRVLSLILQQQSKTFIYGSAGTLDSVVALQSELSVQPLYNGMPHYTNMLEVYEEAGFNVMNLFIVNRTSEGAVLEYDCFMARQARLLFGGDATMPARETPAHPLA